MFVVRKKKSTNPAVEAVLESDDEDEDELGLQMIDEYDEEYGQDGPKAQRKKNISDEMVDSDTVYFKFLLANVC